MGKNKLIGARRFLKRRHAWLLTAVIALTMTTGAEMTVLANSDLSKKSTSVVTSSSLVGQTNQNNQAASENSNSRANGDLTYQWGTCPLNLTNGTLTVRTGELSVAKPSELNDLLESGNVTTIHVEKGVKLPTDSSNLFAGLTKIGSITFEKEIDTSNVTNMTGMFMGDSGLISLDLSSFDTTNVTLMKAMFAGATQLQSLDLSSFDTVKAADTIDNGEPGTTYMLGFKGGPYDMLLSNLWQIKVGPNTVIKDPTENEDLKIAGLPEVPGTAQSPHEFTDKNFPGATFQNDGSNWVEAGTSVDGHNPTGTDFKDRLAFKDYLAKARGNTETWVWQQAKATKQTITLRYIDQYGNQIANSQIFSGYPGTSYDVSDAKYQPTIGGYAFNQVVGNLKGTYREVPMTITFEYSRNSTGANPGSTIPATPLTPATPIPDTSTPTPTTPGQPVEVKYAFPFKVYAKTTVYKYRTANFKKSQRIRKYVKQPRYKASVFTVTKAIKNAQGRWRYKVAGGYLTANEKNIGLLYWQSGKYRKLTVINSKGVYESRSRLLAKRNRVQHLKQGTTVSVKAVVHDGMATRYVLNNGHYITGNKKFVSLRLS